MKSLTSRIPPAVAEKLGYYIYLYVDPSTNRVFYVGKGKGSRALSHLGATEQEKKDMYEQIKSIRDAGLEPRIELLAYCLGDEKAALQIESAAIELLGLKNLANRIRGFKGAKLARMPLEQVIAHFHHKPAEITEPAILIRINRLYQYGMTDQELYDATRSAWRVSEEKREKVKYAFAIFEGVVREVYQVNGWHPGGSTFNKRYQGIEVNRNGRWEFVGVPAPDQIRRKYLNRYVGDLFKVNNQNPVFYRNI
jgi:hypothetical protein